MRREQQRAFGHARQQPGDSRTKGVTAPLAAVVEDVPALGVEHGSVQVEPTPRVFAVGLGHEGCTQTMLTRHATDDELEQRGVIGGFHGIRTVQQIDFKLPLPALGNRGVGGHVPSLARLIQIVGKALERFEQIDRIEAGVDHALAGTWDQRWLHLGELRVEQVEFELGGAHRRQPGLRAGAGDGL